MFDKLKGLKDLQGQAKQMQAELASQRITSSEGGVVLTLDGNMNIADIEISDHLLNLESKEKLKIAIRQAHKSAMKKAQKQMAEKMRSSGLNLPGLG